MEELNSHMHRLLADPLLRARKVTDPVGYVGLDLPLDLTSIPDRVFCHLPWETRRRSTPLADKWLESAFPGWAKSIVQDWFEGRFNLFSHVVFSRGDDASQRLYYYLCELRRRGVVGGPEPLIFDVACIQRESSIRHCESALRRLMAALHIDGNMLDRGIAQANGLREIFTDIELTRRYPGSVVENIARASLSGNLLPQLQAAASFPDAGGARRLVLAGSVPPDDRLHLAAEAKGWTVAGELHARSLRRHGEAVNDTGDLAIRELAIRANVSPFGPRAFIQRTDSLLAEIKRADAEAAVLWLTEQDEAFAWHVADQIKVLRARGIPLLVLTRRRWDGEDGADAALQTFLEEQAA